MTSIRPCPFCGSDDVTFLDVAWGANCSDDPDDPDYGFAVMCNRCGAIGPTMGGGQSRAQAAKSWRWRGHIPGDDL